MHAVIFYRKYGNTIFPEKTSRWIGLCKESFRTSWIGQILTVKVDKLITGVIV